jgi:hypothetical protein
MAKDVGISITSQDCETDWEDIINLIADDDEFLEPVSFILYF